MVLQPQRTHHDLIVITVKVEKLQDFAEWCSVQYCKTSKTRPPLCQQNWVSTLVVSAQTPINEIGQCQRFIIINNRGAPSKVDSFPLKPLFKLLQLWLGPTHFLLSRSSSQEKKGRFIFPRNQVLSREFMVTMLINAWWVYLVSDSNSVLGARKDQSPTNACPWVAKGPMSSSW